ncbi:GNAT family N-acetyltransferase [Neptunicella sp. SCSIO 80796]|uniref:GNAT family N-acetyltransferase n=1 Tax=Neptunicella plasticusilytica TaxID=3117012 RepID=UPI003A4DD03C
MQHNLEQPLSTGTQLEFLPYSSDLAGHFKTINEQWISAMFAIEPADLASLDHPQELIIDRGGQIYFVKTEQLGVIGCCALLPKENGVFELTKMGVLDSARGLKAGEALLQYVLQQAKNLPIKRLFLLTNKKCEAAVHLYEKNGFVHDKQVMDQYGSSYQRCNVAMKYPPIWQD